MEQFTLEEAQRWLGRTTIAKTDFEAEDTRIAAEQQGTIIGMDGRGTLSGGPVMCLAVQFWSEQDDTVPQVLFFDKRILLVNPYPQCMSFAL
jgi:hypothetical protein